jgi:hypothetical protein
MPMLVYEGRLPTPEQFKIDWENVLAATNPIDDLLALVGELYHFEQKYNMASEEFYQKYTDGTLDDELQHCLIWAATYRMFTKCKRQIENVLMHAAIQTERNTQPELEKVAA